MNRPETPGPAGGARDCAANPPPAHTTRRTDPSHRTPGTHNGDADGADRTAWARDLALGARFAVSGRESWVRTALTALGVGLGVAVLLLACAVPAMLHARDERSTARMLSSSAGDLKPGPDTLLILRTGTTYHGHDLYGVLVKAEGSRPVHIPGVATLPRPGQMLVSPRLRELLRSPGGALLRDRLPYQDVGDIGRAGLLGPNEYVYYAGSDALHLGAATGVERIDRVGQPLGQEGLGTVLTLLAVVTCVVLLVPVGVFVATAARLGGERRDRRLAALRLVGTDIRGTYRIAAGESLVGAGFGLVIGAVLFLIGRQLIGLATVAGMSVFPQDVDPGVGTAVLVLVGVPSSAVAVTFLALRSVAVEPLGVVRSGAPRPRRVWWRVLLPVAGLLALAPLIARRNGVSGDRERDLAAGGVLLLLVGLVALLPWLLERVVGRLGRGPLPIQLGSRRLQLSGGTTSRAIGGITVAVAGAISVQLLFTGVSGQYTFDTGQDPSRAQAVVSSGYASGADAAPFVARLRATPGVSAVLPTVSTWTVGAHGTGDAMVTVGDCAVLAQLATVPGCAPGSVYLLDDPDGPDRSDGSDGSDAALRPGRTLVLPSTDPRHSDAPGAHWRIPATARTAVARTSPDGVVQSGGVLATPQALPPKLMGSAMGTALLRLDPHDPDALERVRNTAARTDPTIAVSEITRKSVAHRYDSLRTGLTVGAVVVLGLIALSLALTTAEQLRERRRLLAVLVAFGTRRSTLVWSVLWQSAVPVALGMALALGCGLGLGAALLRISHTAFTADWTAVAVLVLAGAGAVAATTLLSLPALWRMMRPDGLRTE